MWRPAVWLSCWTCASMRWSIVLLVVVGVHATSWLLFASMRNPVDADAHQRTPGPVAATGHAYAALCAIFKNEHGNVQQWIEYHRWLGVGQFYVFDHGSSPPLALELESYVQEGVVELHYFAGDAWQRDAPNHQSAVRQFLSPQAWAYDNCFRWYGHRHMFIGMLDADEYVVLQDVAPGQQPNLTAFLRPFEAHGGLVMQWQLFGPSGHSSRPTEETMLAYTSCIPKLALQGLLEFQQIPHGYTKSFTNTRFFKDGCDPHRCSLSGATYVNEDLLPATPQRLLEVHWSRIAVFHYITRSIDEYEQKLQRGSGHSQYSHLSKRLGFTGRGWQFFVNINDLSTEECLQGVEAYRACCAAEACTCTEPSNHSQPLMAIE